MEPYALCQRGRALLGIPVVHDHAEACIVEGCSQQEQTGCLAHASERFGRRDDDFYLANVDGDRRHGNVARVWSTARRSEEGSQGEILHLLANNWLLDSVNFGVNQPIPIPVKRTLPALCLSKTPLIFVLAQVRVAPIAQIEKFLPLVQETLRHQGFPGLLKRKFQIEQGAPDGSKTTESRTQWEFINAERNRSILVDEASLVLQTTAYDSGECFLEHLRLALDAFTAHAKPTNLQRIGLRYIDLIKPIAGLGLSDLLVAGLRLETLPLPGEPLTRFWQSLRATSADTKLQVRFTEANQGFAFPPDIGPFISLNLREPPVQNSAFGLLDTDHFDERATPFASEDVISRTADLHDVLDQSFRNLVTPAAIQVWK